MATAHVVVNTQRSHNDQELNYSLVRWQFGVILFCFLWNIG